MARGVRKTNRQKVESQLQEIKESILQYKDCLKTLEAKERLLEEELEEEKMKEIFQLLKQNQLSAEDVREMILEHVQVEQGA